LIKREDLERKSKQQMRSTTMNEPKIRIAGALLLVLGLLQTAPVLARSDDLIRGDINARLAAEEKLRDARIEVRVEERLVVLIGQVRLYEQKLISDRIAWTTSGVVEVDNEIRVVPKLPLADAAIERRIREIVATHERFRNVPVAIRVDKGKVTLTGSFLAYRDPSILKHKVAEIEGVVKIEISAAFLAR
jgi:osmotically-inducible protein OsmY